MRTRKFTIEITDVLNFQFGIPTTKQIHEMLMKELPDGMFSDVNEIYVKE